MIVKGATKEQIQIALDEVNKRFENNIRFKELVHIGKTRQGTPKFKVLLTVKDSHKPGSRRSWQGRRIAAACWHVHGYFYDALPVGTQIEAMGRKLIAGDAWQDWQAGPHVMASDLCEC